MFDDSTLEKKNSFITLFGFNETFHNQIYKKNLVSLQAGLKNPTTYLVLCKLSTLVLS